MWAQNSMLGVPRVAVCFFFMISFIIPVVPFYFMRYPVGYDPDSRGRPYGKIHDFCNQVAHYKSRDSIKNNFTRWVPPEGYDPKKRTRRAFTDPGIPHVPKKWTPPVGYVPVFWNYRKINRSDV